MLRHAHDERGATLVIFAIWLPVLMIFVTFVVDVGNWFEHHRHLQTQADAAVLAGGGVWTYPCSGSAEAAIEGTARDYGGRHVGHTTPSPYDPAIYNDQIGGTPPSRLHLLLNSTKYWNEGGSDHSDGGGPCATGFLDAKITESNLPFFFPFGGQLVPAINAHARVQIQQATTLNGLLPLFVRDVNPKAAAAIFIDDATHTVLDAQYMDKLPPASCTSGLQCWSSLSAPSTVTIAPRTSLVVALSSVDRCPQSGPCLARPAAGTSADSACTQAGVECFGEDTASNLQAGLVFVRGYPTGGGGDPPADPALRDVELSGDPSLTPTPTCPDGYFVFTKSNCNAFIQAKVDVGTFDPANVEIAAFNSSCGGKNGCALQYDAASGYWTGSIPVTALKDPATDGISLMWQLINTTLTSKGACDTSFSDFTGGSAKNLCVGAFEGGATVQRTYSGQDQFSGPIRSATVWNIDDPLGPFPGLGANAYVSGSSHDLFATIALAGGVATDSSDKPIQLRVAGNQAAIDCDPTIATFREELATGCQPYYAINTRLGQADPCNPPYGTVTSDLFKAPNPPPWECVGTQNGVSVGQFTQGIQARVLGASAPACPTDAAGFVPGRNYWGGGPPYNIGSSAWVGGTFDVRDDDPRLVLLFMVPFGAFRTTGQSLFPITSFGAYYITGWGGNGGGNDDPCPGADTNVPAGWLSGHFIKLKLPSNTSGGTVPCDPSSTTPCVAVLTE